MRTIKQWRLLLFIVPFAVNCIAQTPTSAPIAIEGPLEGSVGGDIRIVCTASSSTVSQGLSVIFQNRQRYTEPTAVSDEGNTRTIVLERVTADLNGTEVACAFLELTSAFLPVLLFSGPVLEANVSLMMLDVREGGTRMIATGVRGYPYPMVNVTRGDQEVGAAVSASPSTIVLSNVNRADTGIYTFTFFNSEGEATFTLNLTVLYPPTFSDTISTDFFCDVSTSSTAQCSAQMGSSGSLRCDFDAVPSAWLTFTPPTGSRATLNPSGTAILVSDARQEDSGVYVCTANSTEYSSERRISLQVGTLPSEVSSVSIDILDSTVNVSWTYDNSGSQISLSNFTITIEPVTGTEVVYSSTALGSLRSLEVPKSELEEDVNYQVSVVAYNVLGKGAGTESVFKFPVSTTLPPNSSGGSKSTVSSYLQVLQVCSLVLSSYMR